MKKLVSLMALALLLATAVTPASMAQVNGPPPPPTKGG